MSLLPAALFIDQGATFRRVYIVPGSDVLTVGKVIDFSSMSFQYAIASAETDDPIEQRVKDYQRAASIAGKNGYELRGYVEALCGPVTPDGSGFRNATNIAGVGALDIRTPVEDECGTSYFGINDGSALALGVYDRDAVIGDATNVLVFKFGTGIACGHVRAGQVNMVDLLEPGHNWFKDSDVTGLPDALCGCGNNGDWESRSGGGTSEYGILGRARRSSDPVLNAVSDTGDIISLAHNDHELARKMIEDANVANVYAIASLIQTYGPEVVVLSGKYMSDHSKKNFEYVQSNLPSHIMRGAPNVRLELTTLDNDIPYGLVAYARMLAAEERLLLE